MKKQETREFQKRGKKAGVQIKTKEIVTSPRWKSNGMATKSVNKEYAHYKINWNNTNDKHTKNKEITVLFRGNTILFEMHQNLSAITDNPKK